MRHCTSSFVAFPALQYLPISNKWFDFGKKKIAIEHKMCFYFCYISFLQYFSYLLTPWCRVLLEKLTGLQLVKKFPAFHGTRRFITALTSVRHLSLFWASPIQSIYPHPTFWRSILILSIHLRLGLPRGLFPSGFPTKRISHTKKNYAKQEMYIGLHSKYHYYRQILIKFEISKQILEKNFKNEIS